MNKILVLLSLLIISYSQLSLLNVDLSKSIVIPKEDVFRAFIAVSGGTSPYIYTYSQIPQNWVHIDKFIFVPKDDVLLPKKYIVRISIKDNFLNEVKAAVVFIADGKLLKIDPIVYSFNHVFPPTFLLVQPNLSPSPVGLIPFTTVNDLIEGSKVAQVRVGAVIDPRYGILPTVSQINGFILSNNLTSLLQIIQTVQILDLGCVERISYLEEIISRMLSAIEITKLQIAKLQIYNLAAQNQINKLQLELLNLQSQKEGLKLSVLLPLLNEKKLNLAKIQRLLATVDGQIQALQFDIAALNFQLTIKNKQVNDLKVSMAAITIQIQNPLTQPAQLALLSIQLADAQKNIADLEQQILKQSLDKQQKTDSLESLRSLKAKFTLDRAKLVKEILDYNQKVQKNEEKINALNVAIQLTKIQITTEQQKLKTNQIALQTLKLNNLQNLKNNFSLEVNKIYFNCFQIVANIQNGAFTLAYNNFLSYVLQLYQLQVQVQIAPTITLKRLNIFSDLWVNEYGPAFTAQAIALSTGAKFENDFNCLNPAVLQSNFGTILKISNNIIQVQTALSKVYLIIGACTRFESIPVIPVVGGAIYWKGIQLTLGVYDAYFILSV